mgnify:CR=1 FL=1
MDYEQEDLFTVGSIGLIKAVDKFDTSFDVQFSTYAVPMISGEIKRFLRDDGMIKVSRSMKETAYKAYIAREKMEEKLKREPTLTEIAAEIGVTSEELAQAFDASAQIESLHKVIYQGDGSGIVLEDKIEEPENGQESLLNKMLLEQLLGSLEAKERELNLSAVFQEKHRCRLQENLEFRRFRCREWRKRF